MTDQEELDAVTVSRFEVIDHTIAGTGRDFVKYAANRTLTAYLTKSLPVPAIVLSITSNCDTVTAAHSSVSVIIHSLFVTLDLLSAA